MKQQILKTDLLLKKTQNSEKSVQFFLKKNDKNQ